MYVCISSSSSTGRKKCFEQDVVFDYRYIIPLIRVSLDFSPWMKHLAETTILTGGYVHE